MALVMVAARLAAGATNSAAADVKVPAASLVQLRGRVVCLAEEMHRLHQAALPTGHEHVWGFRTEEGTYYTLLRAKLSEALFADKRFRERELMLKGRIFAGTQIFETTIIRSVRNGLVHDIYYYCTVCDIQGVAPGPCECCQGPTELVEKPLPK